MGNTMCNVHYTKFSVIKYRPITLYVWKTTFFMWSTSNNWSSTIPNVDSLVRIIVCHRSALSTQVTGQEILMIQSDLYYPRNSISTPKYPRGLSVLCFSKLQKRRNDMSFSLYTSSVVVRWMAWGLWWWLWWTAHITAVSSGRSFTLSWGFVLTQSLS